MADFAQLAVKISSRAAGDLLPWSERFQTSVEEKLEWRPAVDLGKSCDSRLMSWYISRLSDGEMSAVLPRNAIVRVKSFLSSLPLISDRKNEL